MSEHSDRERWDARYGGGFRPSFAAHPLAVRALAVLGAGGPERLPVLDLACGPSGSALVAAERGHRVVAVDISEVALGMLGAEAEARGLAALITLVSADLGAWRPEAGRFGLVLCTGYWDRELFPEAARGVAEGGLLAWEAFTVEAMRVRPGLPRQWCLAPGEPASLLPDGFEVICQEDVPGEAGVARTKRRLLSRRLG